ncbi:MAG TPA: hypothetical protein VLA95_05855 [Gemmatimonadales bacterium]|nr:hypothetical protein [Gemmatimonadales bacterium]
MSRLAVGGAVVVERRVERTEPHFPSEEGVDVGMDNETPVTDECGANRFTGRILGVTVAAEPPPAAGP